MAGNVGTHTFVNIILPYYFTTINNAKSNTIFINVHFRKKNPQIHIFLWSKIKKIFCKLTPPTLYSPIEFIVHIRVNLVFFLNPLTCSSSNIHNNTLLLLKNMTYVFGFPKKFPVRVFLPFLSGFSIIVHFHFPGIGFLMVPLFLQISKPSCHVDSLDVVEKLLKLWGHFRL